MGKNRKLLLQVVICLGLLATVRGSALLDDQKVDEIKKTVGHMIEKHYTLQDLKDLGKDAAETIADVPAAVSQAVIDANEKGQYGVPIDEDDGDSEKAIKPVHAVAGGRILKSGISKDLGMYVTIEHTDKVSTYGRLCDLTMISGDRVKKGDIIGSYDSGCGSDFYYALEDKL